MLKLGGTFQIWGFTSLVLQTGNLSPQIRRHVLRSNSTSEATLSLTLILSSPEWLALTPSSQPLHRSYFVARISLKWHQSTLALSGVFLPQGASISQSRREVCSEWHECSQGPSSDEWYPVSQVHITPSASHL